MKTMQKIPIHLIMAFLFSLGLTELYAQEAITTSGGEATGSGGTLSYTVGQVTYTTFTGSTGTLEQGVQHTYLITDGDDNGTNLEQTITLKHMVYPNPARDHLTLQVETSQTRQLSFGLYDLKGKLVMFNRIITTNTNINMIKLQPAIYFLKIYQENQEIQTFKIIKY